MIIKTENEIIVQFGDGTVRVMKAGNKGKDAFIGLKTQKYKTLGSLIRHGMEGKELELLKPEVILAFNNAESLDIVIEELKLLRTEIYGNNE